jgi:hypothetical protein
MYASESFLFFTIFFGFFSLISCLQTFSCLAQDRGCRLWIDKEHIHRHISSSFNYP